MTTASDEGGFEPDSVMIPDSMMIMDSWEDDEEVDDVPDSYAEPELLLPTRDLLQQG